RVPRDLDVPAARPRHLDATAAPLAALGDRAHRRLRRGHHAESGSLLAVRDGDTHVPLLRDRDHHRKAVEAMSQRRRTPYKPRRNRRELAMAILAASAIVLVTAVLVWVLRPNKDLGSDTTKFPEPTTTVAPGDTTAPTTAPSATSTP